MRTGLVVTVLILMSVLPTCAYAEWNAGLELAMNRDSDDWSLASVIDGSYSYKKNWKLVGKWGLVSEIQTSNSEHGWKEFKIGNPFFAVDWQQELSLLDWSVGLGVALPLAALDQYDRHGRVAYGKAAALFGLRDIWLWAPNRLGIAVPAKATIFRNWYRLGADCAISVLVPTRDTLGSGTDFIGQARFTASVIESFLEAGAYGQAVGFATSSNEHLQLAIAPFLRVNSGKIGVGIESLIPLDAPLANQNRWSLHFMFQIRGNNE